MTLRSIIVAAEAIVAVCLSDTVVYYERTVWLMVFLYEDHHEKDPRIGDVTFVHYRRHVIPTVQTTVTFLCSRPVRA